MRVVAYIPPAPRRETAAWHQQLSTQADVEGFQVTHVTADPDEARRLVETGTVDRVAFAQREHAEQVYPIVVPAVPHPRRRRGPAMLGGLLPVGWAVEWARRHPARAASAAATAAAAVLGAALLLPALGEDEPASLAEPPWVEPTASTAAPATPDAPEPTPPPPTPSPEPTTPPADPQQPASTPTAAAPTPGAEGNGGGGAVQPPAPPPAPEPEPEDPPPPPAPAPPPEPTQDDEDSLLCVRVGLPVVDADLCVL